MDGFDEGDIERAIQLSLLESQAATTGARPRPPAKLASEVIEISDDEEDVPAPTPAARGFDAEMQAALDASRRAAPLAGAAKSNPSTHAPDAPSRTGSTTGFLSERAKMERERLERLKRVRPDLASAQAQAGKRGLDLEEEYDSEDADEEVSGRDAKRQRVIPPDSSVRRTNGTSSSASASASRSAGQGQGNAKGKARQDAEELFWEGELRQTACKHVDPAKDTRPVFRLSEIIAPKDELHFAVLSAYCVNWPWLYSFFNPNTPVVVVAHDTQGNETIKEVLPNWVKTTPFLRNGMGCMHMKFMLLFYKSKRLRVVVSTANLIEHDWRDIENSVWVQDVPPLSAPIPHDAKADDFPAAFMRVLRGVNFAPALISTLRNAQADLPLRRIEDLRCNWDFSKVKVKLVPSLAGKHEGWPKVIQTGHTALMKAIRDIGGIADKGKQVVLECQGSSIGTYSTQWLNEFHHSARGLSAQDWLDAPKARRTKLPFPAVKILFPTLGYVRESALGEAGGGTMFCRRNQWEAPKFPRELFYQTRSKRGKTLMHSKMILATIRSGTSFAPAEASETEPESDDEVVEVSRETGRPLVGWAYVGSHNFTPSAWGTLSGSAFNPTLNITNHELGVLIPVHSEGEAGKIACWERPPKKYALGKDVPWFQSESVAFVED